MTDAAYDVLILGGGLAGLTLALQLRNAMPALSVRVLERRHHPVPEATHKVGESSVEIAGHYFGTVLGLKQHMETRQLRKFGFRFFFSEGRRDLDGVVELGASRFLNTPSYQIDRGIFENYLGELVRERGIEFIDGAMVRNVELNGGTEPHRVRYVRADVEVETSARWVIDASGRAGILKRKLDLAQDNAHDANAIWFRIGTRLDVDRWVDNPEWAARCNPQARWLSTNHLVGRGYWAWLIPLSSGSHSVGIVADARTHPLSSMNTYDKAIAWFERHQPLIAEQLADKRELLQDFCALRNFSYGCKQVFSHERWALTGEAGVFLDPFYSPGSDFIAIGNTYITDLIARELKGESISARARIYEQLYFSFYESTLSLYVDQYDLFGDPEVLPVKVIWDYAYYWGVLCQFFFHDRLTDLQSVSKLSAELHGTKALNHAMQDFFRVWSGFSAKRNGAHMLDQAALPWFAELNRGLRDELSEAQFRERLKQTTQQLHVLAAQILERATAAHPQLDTTGIMPLLAGTCASAMESLLFAA